MEKKWKLSVTLLLMIDTCQSVRQKPNVIFILADDLGWNDVSFHGSQQIPTPNLDTLAYDGVILSNYYVAPICTPTRGALMTGRHPIHTGLQHSVLFSSETWGLPLNETIMPQFFKNMGYDAHMVGKWHLGFFAREYTPTYRGFDSHIGYYQGMEDYWDHSYCATGMKKESCGMDFHKNGEVQKQYFGKYSTEIFNDETIKLINSHDTEKPLFMYLPFQSVHSGNPITPLEAPYKYTSKFEHIANKARRNFAGMVSALDDAVGNITAALHAKGMLNNTIIAFSTDNGGPANGFDYNMANNWPLRGTKEGLWEGGVRGTGFLWSPLLKKSGYISKQMMTVEDWLPTLLSGAGYDMPSLPDSLDGMDMWTVLGTEGSDSPRTELLHNIDDLEQSWAVRTGEWKLIYGNGGATKGWQSWYPPVGVDFELPTYEGQDYKNAVFKDSQSAAMTQQYDHLNSDLWHEALKEAAPAEMFKSDLRNILKSMGRPSPEGTPLVVECGPIPANASSNCHVDKAPCLYNVVTDPCEFHNLAEELPDVVHHLLWSLNNYNKTAVPPLVTPVDPKGLPINHHGLWVPWVNLKKPDEQ